MWEWENRQTDYHKVITQPMDLGTIKRRLEKGHHYAHPDLVHPDIALVFANAMQYNPPGSDVHVMASTLQELCSSKWAAMVTPRLVEVSVRSRTIRSPPLRVHWPGETVATPSVAAKAPKNMSDGPSGVCVW